MQEKADWINYVRQGKIVQGYKDYIKQPNPDKVVLKILISLMSVQRYLRAKLWQRACDELISCESWPDFLDWQVLQKDLQILIETSNLLDHHDPEKALEALQKVNLNVYKAEVETQKGIAYIFLNEQQKAEVAFAEALKLDPEHYRALTNQGNLRLEQDNIDSAIATYQKALSINSSFSNALHNLGIAYRRQGKLSKSIRVLRKAQAAKQRELKDSAKAPKRSVRHWQYVFYGVLILLFFLWLMR